MSSLLFYSWAQEKLRLILEELSETGLFTLSSSLTAFHFDTIHDFFDLISSEVENPTGKILSE